MGQPRVGFVVGAKKLTLAEVKAYVLSHGKMGLPTASAFLVRQLKAVVGIQAPRRRSKSAPSGWVATTRATSGAPPRRVSGQGQASIYWRWVGDRNIAIGAKKNYMMILERKNHPWLHKTVKENFQYWLRLVYGNKSRL
jgi:hypothetical protein